MIRYLETKISDLRYSDQGEGDVLILLHGYLESIETFDAFARDLATKARVVCIDLPGHGKSTLKLNHVGVEEMAEAVFALIVELNLGKVHLMSHSMGGYVALAFADKYVDNLTSFSLLHSSANADTEEKRNNRSREIELVRNGKKELICNNAIPNTFSKSNQKIFSDDIETLIKIASNTEDKGVVVALSAMMNRPDRNKVFKALQIPKYSFIGREDNFIPFEKGLEWANVNGVQPVIFENSGHMSFIEERELCVKAVRSIMKSE